MALYCCHRLQPTKYLYHRIYTVVKKIMAIICQSYIYIVILSYEYIIYKYKSYKKDYL